MAKVIGDDKLWTAVIRCAHPVCGYGLYRVDGCFSLIEIGLDDIHGSLDCDGDWTFWVDCPKCGQRLYPRWQIGDGPLEIVTRRLREKKERT